MDLLLVLVAAAVFPVGCLGFVLWMSRIEDTIPASVARAVRRPDPAPVLRIPVRRPVPAPVPVTSATVAVTGPVEALVIPAQRGDAPALDVPLPLATAPPAPVAPAAPAGT